jgi:hypothetical protein
MKGKMNNMNNVVKYIYKSNIKKTETLYKLLDKVLELQNLAFPGNDVQCDIKNIIFITDIDEYKVTINIDMNKFSVISRISNKADVVFAECVLTIDGIFEEKYTRIKRSFKNKVAEWFTSIGEIDITSLIASSLDDVNNSNVEEPTAEESSSEPEDSNQ